MFFLPFLYNGQMEHLDVHLTFCLAKNPASLAAARGPGVSKYQQVWGPRIWTKSSGSSLGLGDDVGTNTLAGGFQ